MTYFLVAYGPAIRVSGKCSDAESAMKECFGIADSKRMSCLALLSSPKSHSAKTMQELHQKLERHHKEKIQQLDAKPNSPIKAEIHMTPIKHEIKDEILKMTLENGEEIHVELFVRAGNKGPQISASAQLVVVPVVSNRLTITAERF